MNLPDRKKNAELSCGYSVQNKKRMIPSSLSLSNIPQIQSSTSGVFTHAIFEDKVHHLFDQKKIDDNLRNFLINNTLQRNIQKIVYIFNAEKLNEDRKPNINWKYKKGDTVLHIVSKKGDIEFVKVILDLNADIEEINDNNETPLMIATLYNNYDLCDLLLSYGANINCIDKKGNTPLIIASQMGYNKLLKLFLLHNADINIKNKCNQTCLDVIKDYNVYSIFEKYLTPDERKLYKDKYSRTLIKKFNQVLHNNRKDYYESIKFKQKIYYIKLYHTNTFFNEYLLNNVFNNQSYIDLPKKPTLDDFDFLELLGKGGFGEVYLVRLKKTKHLYALKATEKRILDEPYMKKYVEIERKVYQYFHNPFIVSFYRAFQTDYCLYLLIEPMLNGSLKRYIKRYKTFSEDDTRLIAAQLVLAIEHLHRQGIIYRDLKPDNILIDSNGYIKITDFGLCKDNIYTNFATKSFCGSICYLPPEIANNAVYGRAVDWYLLGTVIFEMLNGQPPYFTKLGKEAYIDNIRYSHLKFIKENLSSDAESLIRALLNRKIEKRLGAGLSDCEEIKKHPFFKKIDFNKIYNKCFIPPSFLREKIHDDRKKIKNILKEAETNKDKIPIYLKDKEYSQTIQSDSTAKKQFQNLSDWNFEGYEI